MAKEIRKLVFQDEDSRLVFLQDSENYQQFIVEHKATDSLGNPTWGYTKAWRKESNYSLGRNSNSLVFDALVSYLKLSMEKK